ncbi:hypothetical protein [Pseudoduganella namucuonensis]|uniref:Uncharacterized protein n=1 Tax=Pseudoduganella namucuonensis TaxID=1035707 RepID=A0A1I7JP80_9BURK|nr:hypothetical protein [Pseudoduganella namucuonensis]SFU86991.1 hypothetical protein SAMN05216552_1012113 [Pseudoduganella namucuonensis]
MNIAKNMEVIFVAAAVLLGGTSLAVAKTAPRPQPKLEQPAFAGKMPVVVVSAKRPGAAEKAALAG